MPARKTARRRSWGTLRVMRNGNVQASYLHDDGHRYYARRPFEARIDAEGWLAKERKLIDLGEWTPPESRDAARAVQSVTLRAYAAKWMNPEWREKYWADAARELTPKSHALYTRLLDSRILPGLGDELLSAVTAADVRAWWVGMGKETPTLIGRRTNFSKASSTRRWRRRRSPRTPARSRRQGSRPKPREVEWLTPAELMKVAEAAPAAYRAAIPVTAFCGLRLGELIELRRKDCQERDGRMVLSIERSATRVNDVLIVGPPKTEAGIRKVTVPPHIAELLREHMKAHTGKSPEAFVFTTTRGQRLSSTALTKAVKAGFADVGKPTMRIHDLRHVGATLAAQAGATTKELMLRIGHTTPAMAMRYQHAAAERDAHIADQLSKLAGQ